MRRNRVSMPKSAQVLGGVCPLCGQMVEGSLREHLRRHGDSALKEAILQAKLAGISDGEIGKQFGISYNTLQRTLTEAQGINVSPHRRTKPIQRWEPLGFQEEQTTVWSFPQRGDWATHNGHYRGNWSPYIPRNLILKYSRPGEIVLDYFVGGGTTAVEAKLLGRRCIALDINPAAVELTLKNLAFAPPLFNALDVEIFEPDVDVGDARSLASIPDESIDLICSHPPYAGIIKYSTGIEGDLSGLEPDAFFTEMRRVAEESYRVLKPGGKCAILIGDGRKARRVVPIGFETIRVFLNAGFRLKELIIKRQHNCKTTGFWYKRSIQHNFLLLAHEYLPIFEKVKDGASAIPTSEQPVEPVFSVIDPCSTNTDPEKPLETTTVWVLPEDIVEHELARNLAARYSDERTLVVASRDERRAGAIIPNGLLTYEAMRSNPSLNLREIIIVAPTSSSARPLAEDGNIQIVHRYIFVYDRKER